MPKNESSFEHNHRKQTEEELLSPHHDLDERNEELARKLSELQIVSELGQALLAATSSGEVLHMATEMLGGHLEATHACAVTEEPGGSLEITHAYNLTPDRVVALNRDLSRLCPEIIQAVVRAKRGELTTVYNAPDSAECCDLCEQQNSTVCLPIRSPGRQQHHIVVFLPYQRKWSKEERRFLTALGDQIALTLENTLLVQELNTKNAELKMANRLKSQLLANVSHELRTPLNSVIGFAEILLERSFGDLTDRQEKYVNNIIISGKHLLQVINDILDLAKVEAGRMNLQPEPFEVKETLEGICAIVSPLAKKKKIALQLSVAEDVAQITADPARFKQILYNLLSNAIKFTPESGKVETSAALVDGRLRLSVSDSGIGIRPEDQNRIFAKFQQADGSLSREHEGTGLGLPLTKSLVEMHGGEISLTSTLGKGSTFTVHLPLSPTATEATCEEVEDQGSSILINDSEAEQMVIVVEPDPTLRQMFSRWLTEAGYSVVDTDQGSDVLPLAKGLKPALITLDILLPDKDGWAVMEELRENCDTKTIPFMVISSVDSRNLAYSMGASDYLVKPVEAKQLVQAAQNITEESGALEGPVSCLIVSQSSDLTEILSDILEERGLAVVTAPSLDGAQTTLAAEQPDIAVIVADEASTGIDDLTGFRKLPATEGTAVVIAVPPDYPAEARATLIAGGDQLVELDTDLAENLSKIVERLHIPASEKALIDPVTGLFNARSFHRQVSREISRALPGTELSIIMTEIENFAELKRKNLQLAEIVLKTVGKLLKNDSRFYDFCCRYGGEKFALILPGTPHQPTVQKAGRIAELIRKEAFFPTGTGRQRLNLLTAVVTYPGDGAVPSALTAKACEALRKFRRNAGTLDQREAAHG